MDKLKNLIKNKGHSFAEIARLLDISWNALYFKLNGRHPFTLRESFMIKEYLGMNWNEYYSIFKED